jgi:phosphatidylinositol dimannoside acyltransferase
VKFKESPLKDLYRVGLWYGIRPSLRALPPGHEFEVFRALGRQACRLPSHTRQLVDDNLGRVFGPGPDLEELRERVFEEHFCTQYVSFTFPRIGPDTIPDYIRMHGVEHLERAAASGRGVVLAHPHMGCAQLPHFDLAHRGYRMMQIGGGGANLRFSRLGQRVADTRVRLENLIPAQLMDGQGFIRPVLRHLQGGGVLLTAVDGTGSGDEIGRRVERTVLGQRFRTPVGPVYLARRSGAALLPLWVVRREDGPGFDGFIEPEIPLPDLPMRPLLDWGADLMALLLDEWLGQYPGEWDFWDEFHPRDGGLLYE